MEKVLVVGANGTTGKKIVEILDRYRNYSPVAMIRHQDQAEQFEKKDIETDYITPNTIQPDIEIDTSNVDYSTLDNHEYGTRIKYYVLNNGKRIDMI